MLEFCIGGSNGLGWWWWWRRDLISDTEEIGLNGYWWFENNVTRMIDDEENTLFWEDIMLAGAPFYTRFKRLLLG